VLPSLSTELLAAQHGAWTVNPALVNVTALGGNSTTVLASNRAFRNRLQNGESVNALTD